MFCPKKKTAKIFDASRRKQVMTPPPESLTTNPKKGVEPNKKLPQEYELVKSQK
jgi:hypothetical protein